MGYELGTFLHYLGDLYQYVLHGIDLRWRAVVQNELVSLPNARGKILDRCVEVGLRQDRLCIVGLIDLIKDSNLYLRGCSQYSQRQLSVWMDLNVTFRRNMTSASGAQTLAILLTTVLKM